MTLVELLATKAPGRVLGFTPNCAHVVALMELGFVPGTRVSVVRQAPLGCPLEIDVAGARLAVRRDVAATILVSLEPAATVEASSSSSSSSLSPSSSSPKVRS